MTTKGRQCVLLQKKTKVAQRMVSLEWILTIRNLVTRNAIAHEGNYFVYITTNAKDCDEIVASLNKVNDGNNGNKLNNGVYKTRKKKKKSSFMSSER